MSVLLTNYGADLELVGQDAYDLLPFGYGFWSRYLDVFDEVVVFTRGHRVDEASPKAHKATGPRVGVFPIPGWSGLNFPFIAMIMFIRAFQAVRRADAVLLQAPSIESIPLSIFAKLLSKPQAVYMRSEHFVSLDYLKNTRRSPGAVWIVRFFSFFYSEQRRNSTIGVYVSEYLRKKYPLPEGRPSEVISSVQLYPIFFHDPRSFSPDDGCRVIITVASLSPEKGIDELIRAVSRLSERGVPNWRLRVIGDGPCRSELEQLAGELGLDDRIEFPGWVRWGEDLVEEFRGSDLFVLNSLPSEGLPRAILEASATGLPCISTRVAGAPEVLAGEDIVEPGDTEALGRLIAKVLKDPGRMSSMSARNRKMAERYRRESFREREVALFKVLREASEA